MTLYTKHNHSQFKDGLIREAQGLEILRKVINKNNIPHLKIPKVNFVGEQELQITRIDASSATNQQMQQLGQGLALLHEIPQQSFGFEQDNYIGLIDTTK